MKVLKVIVTFSLIAVLFSHCEKTVEIESDSPITQDFVLRAQAHLTFLEGHRSIEYIHDPETDTWKLLYSTTYKRQPPGKQERDSYFDAGFAKTARIAHAYVLKKNWDKWSEISYKAYFLHHEFGDGGDPILYTYKKDDPIFR